MSERFLQPGDSLMLNPKTKKLDILIREQESIATKDAVDPDADDLKTKYSTPKDVELEQETIDIGKRKTLKTIGGAALSGAVAVSSVKALDTTMRFLSDRYSNTGSLSEADTLNGSKYYEEIYEHPTEEQVSISETDRGVVGETFEEQLRHQDSITINEATKNAIYEKWRTAYSPKDPDFKGKDNYEHGLLVGLKRMQPWLHAMKERFRAHSVPEEFVYLAIPESHFNTDAISSTGAVGPFQFTDYTARLPKINMRMLPNFDERRDPVHSADACARHLKISYAFMGGDWDLALADYNGGFTNGFASHISKKRRTESFQIREDEVHIVQRGDSLSSIAKQYNVSLTHLMRANEFSRKTILQIGMEIKLPQERTPIQKEDFYAWLEDAINAELKMLKNKDHIVVAGDTLSALAKRYDTSIAELQGLNGLSDTLLRVGQKLKTPNASTTTFKRKRAALSKYSENLNYPEKFFAVLDVMKELDLAERFPPTDPAYQEISVPKVEKKEYTYTVKRGDNLGKIAQHIAGELKTIHHISRDPRTMLRWLRQNNQRKGDLIMPGDVFVLNDIAIRKPASLTALADRFPVSLERLKALNPGILYDDRPVPEGVKIRVPK